jgi:hypothetical protein
MKNDTLQQKNRGVHEKQEKFDILKNIYNYFHIRGYH